MNCLISLEMTLNERIGVLIMAKLQGFCIFKISKGWHGRGCFSPSAPP